MEETSFRVKAYSKVELAMLYNPEQCVTVALKKLSRWMQANPSLVGELRKVNYNKYRRSFTPKEVDLIVRHLGDL